jgi:thiol-disulfide isomerase/thioredoxin
MFLQQEKMNTFTSRPDLLESIRPYRSVLILFCTSWCPFCRDFFPKFDRIVPRDSFEKILRVYIDDDNNPLWDDYSLEAVPSAIIFKYGKEVERLDARLGYGLSEKTFREWLAKTR